MLWQVFLALLGLLVCRTLACPDGQVQVTVACTTGSYSNEVRWEVRQNSIVVASGRGGKSANVCLELGQQVVVTGKDTYGDSWNGAVLTISGTVGTVYLSAWSGPSARLTAGRWLRCKAPTASRSMALATSI